MAKEKLGTGKVSKKPTPQRKYGRTKIKLMPDGKMHSGEVHFTDTTENLAKFVAEAGDNLFSKDVLRFERVK